MYLNIIKSVLDNVYTCLRLWPLTLFELSNNIRCSPHVETRMTIPPFERQGTNKPNWHKITGATFLYRILDFFACPKCMKTTYFKSAVTLNSPTVRGMSLTWDDGDSVLLPGHHTDVLLHSRGDEALEDGHVAPHGPLVRHANRVRFPEHCSWWGREETDVEIYY